MSEVDYDVYANKEPAPASSAYWEKRRRIASQMRLIQEGLQTSVLDLETLDTLVVALEQQLGHFDQAPKLLGRIAWLKNEMYGDYGALHNEVTPVVGQSNPLSPPLNIWFKDGSAFASVTFGWVYEGAPEIVHGGFVAAVFDEFLGNAQVISGKSGFTGSLTTRYHQHIPLNKELLLTAKVQKISGRKIIMEGQMLADDVMVASAEGLFIMPRQA